MRFCVLDLSLMTFRYAKSPKEKFTEMKMDEITFAGPKDPKRTKPLKVKNPYDLKYLVNITSNDRTFVFSANSRSDLQMWQSGFDAFFQIKEAYITFARAQHVASKSRAASRARSQNVLSSQQQQQQQRASVEDSQNSINIHKASISKAK